MPPSSLAFYLGAASGLLHAAARSRLREEPIRSLENLSDVDLLIFPGQEMGKLVDADVLDESSPTRRFCLPDRGRRLRCRDAGRRRDSEEPPTDVFQYNDLPRFIATR